MSNSEQQGQRVSQTAARILQTLQSREWWAMYSPEEQIAEVTKILSASEAEARVGDEAKYPIERVHDIDVEPWDIRFFSVEETKRFIDSLHAKIATLRSAGSGDAGAIPRFAPTYDGMLQVGTLNNFDNEEQAWIRETDYLATIRAIKTPTAAKEISK